MTQLITPEILTHLARFAAFSFSIEETEYLCDQLNNQLRSVRELEEISLEESLASPLYGLTFTPEMSSKPRLDTWQPFSKTLEILAQAPEVEDDYFVVPEVTHTELN